MEVHRQPAYHEVADPFLLQSAEDVEVDHLRRSALYIDKMYPESGEKFNDGPGRAVLRIPLGRHVEPAGKLPGGRADPRGRIGEMTEIVYKLIERWNQAG